MINPKKYFDIGESSKSKVAEKKKEEERNYTILREDFVVTVRAQVMVRDDSTGGWIPMSGGGGLANIALIKRYIRSETDDRDHEYVIIGTRIPDQNVLMSSVINDSFEYNKVMPTFHHWKTEQGKYGLTFRSAADARAFDKGLRVAVEELINGLSEHLFGHTYTEVSEDLLRVGAAELLTKPTCSCNCSNRSDSSDSSDRSDPTDRTDRTDRRNRSDRIDRN